MLQEYQLIQNVQLQVQRIQKKYPLISNIDQFQKDIINLFCIETQEILQNQLINVLQQYNLPIQLFECNSLTKKDNQIIVKSQNADIKLVINGKLTYIEHENNISYQIFSNKCMYHGQTLNNKPNGEGSFRWSNGEQYIGQWSNAQKHGFGKWIGIQDDYYIGQWVNGQQDGLGEHKWNGDIYFGQWKNSVKNGYGVEQFQNGDKYIGNYFYGKPQGQGEYRWNDGSTYSGQFLEGFRHGYGRYVNKNGIIYEGEYLNDLKHGTGKLTYKDGSYYYGSFINDQRDGQGVSNQSNNQTVEPDQKQYSSITYPSKSKQESNIDTSQHCHTNSYQTYLNSYQQPNSSFRKNQLQKFELPKLSKQNSKAPSSSTRTYSMNQKRASQIQEGKQNQKSASIDLKDIYIGDAYKTIKKQQAASKNNNNLFLVNNNKMSIKNVFVY